jgi:hypothetical protein
MGTTKHQRIDTFIEQRGQILAGSEAGNFVAGPALFLSA